jgi:hypothetical protein
MMDSMVQDYSYSLSEKSKQPQGNTEEVASRHYVRMVSKADAEQFWSLYPYSETATNFFDFTQQNEETGESGLV